MRWHFLSEVRPRRTELTPYLPLPLHLVAEPKEAARTLQSLACGKVRVLQKHPKGRDVDPSDQFSFNDGFKDEHVKIKINQIQQTATVRVVKGRDGRRVLTFGIFERRPRRTRRRRSACSRIGRRTCSSLSFGASPTPASAFALSSPC